MANQGVSIQTSKRPSSNPSAPISRTGSGGKLYSEAIGYGVNASAEDADVSGNRLAGKYDPNLFLDCQFVNHHLNWVLETGTKPDDDYNLILLRGIANESSFQISGQHDFGAGEVMGISSLVRSGIDALNSFSELGKTGYNFVDTMVKALPTDATKGGIQGGINYLADNLGGKAGEWIKNASNKVIHELLGGHFVTAFDHVKVFKGTNLEVEFPQLTTRIYHNQWRGWSVLKVLDSLIDRFVGDLANVADELGAEGSGSALTGLFGVQKAPNGYEPAFNKLSTNPLEKIPGTFKLTYCGYEIPNLLVSSFSFRLSTLRVREGSEGWDGDPAKLKSTSSPLYLDVSINVQPCTFMSKQVISSIIASKYKEDTTQTNLSELK